MAMARMSTISIHGVGADTKLETSGGFEIDGEQVFTIDVEYEGGIFKFFTERFKTKLGALRAMQAFCLNMLEVVEQAIEQEQPAKAEVKDGNLSTV